jgi:hypothetical protein
LRAISGRKAEMKFSPLANMRLDNTTSIMASRISPCPTHPSSVVNSTQPTVVRNRKRFLCAPWSAMAPSTGALTSTSRLVMVMATVHSSVAVPGAPPATTPTK